MAIEYEVISADALSPGKFRIRPRAKTSVPYEAMVEMVARRTDLTPHQVRAAMDGWQEECLEQIRLGNAASWGRFGHLWVRIKQTLPTQDGGFDPAHGSIGLVLQSTRGWGARLESQLSFEKVQADPVRPQIQNVYDVATQTNNQATRGNIVRITGARLNFDPTDASQGAFFIDGAGAATRASVYERVGPRSVVLLMPNLASTGTFALEVRAKYPFANALRASDYRSTISVL